MRCSCCKKNEATKTYEKVRGGKKTVEYYCLTCYERSFLEPETSVFSDSTDTCPYCGASLADFEKTKLVGCAHCYKTMIKGVMPSIIKMQGKEAHAGKTPAIELPETDAIGRFSVASDEDEALEKLRFSRQCNELEIVLAKLQEIGDYDGAEGYADKLSRMRTTGIVEEEFVWRKNPN